MKYILNTSFVVDPKAHGQWLDLVKHKFIPFLTESKHYSKITLSRILSSEVVDHYTYSLLLDMEELDGYKFYSKEAMELYQEIAVPMFGASVCHIITLMKPV